MHTFIARCHGRCMSHFMRADTAIALLPPTYAYLDGEMGRKIRDQMVREPSFTCASAIYEIVRVTLSELMHNEFPVQ